MFKNESFLDFTVRSNRDEFAQALERVDAKIREGSLYASPIIQGEELKTDDCVPSLDPSDPATVVGQVHFATEQHVEDVFASLSQGKAAWARTPTRERAAILREAAGIMRRRRNELSAIMVREAGKPWTEADADTCEAIDFCDYYAEEMEEKGQFIKTEEVLGEQNVYFYKPRGIGVVISPWNFPLAIACGMTSASLVTGNATVLKPAEQTSIIAFELAKIFLEAGVPPNAFALLPGRGETIGRALVSDARSDVICFTGSREVGLEIIRTAAEVKPGQRSIKKVMAELGGKNAIIIDEDADLDEAIKGIIHSAFGFAGQKCSACSRVIVVGDNYETFMERFCEASKDIIVGAASNPATKLGPVIDQESQQRILATIDSASQENSLAFKGKTPDAGYFVPAAIFRDVAPDTALWKNEIFGPVVACAAVKTFDEALESANNSEYALTGGLFSRSPANIERAYKEFEVGNLYINRGCTGALVKRQPFGGFCMSGVGAKAGGPDYLVQFMEPRTVTENTMRRGFSPDVG